MSNLPNVSIVLPTYNGSKYLRQTLDSVLAQTFRDFELVIVDDCSTDGVPGIIAEYAARDPRVRPIRNETNQRLPRSLNVGHDAARGRYLTWTSDDNNLRPDFLQELVSFLDRNPEVGLVYSDYLEIDDDGHPGNKIEVPPPERQFQQNSVRTSFLYRRELWEKVGKFDPDRFLVEDYEYWIRALQHFRFAPLHKVLYDYRHHAGSLSATRAATIDERVEEVLRQYLPRPFALPAWSFAAGWLRVANICLRRRRFAAAVGAVGRAFLRSPLYTTGIMLRILAPGRLLRRLAHAPLQDQKHP